MGARYTPAVAGMEGFSAMELTIGRYLDSDDDFFNWINGASAALVVLSAAIESGLLDALGDEPAAIQALAVQTGIPEDKLDRLVNFLAAHEVVERVADGRVAQTPRTQRAREAAPAIQCVKFGSLAGGAQLYPALKQGKTAYELAYGKPVFEHLSTNPELGAVFGQFMGFMTRRDARFIFAHHAFEPFGIVADIGGSHGDLLLAMLEHHPEARGILFDLPHTVAQAEGFIGASPHADRVSLVGGSFFEQVPAADLYLLKQILHDWDDEECVAILKTIRKAIPPGGRVAVIDHVLAEVPTPSEGLTTDIAMMIWDTGRERRLSEFAALFEAAGFELDRVSENPQGHSVIEAVPA